MSHPAATLPTMGGKIRSIAVAIALTATALTGCSSPDTPAPSESSTASSASEESIDGSDPIDAPDPYTQPANFKELLQRVRSAVILIGCGDYYGTGWIIDTAAPPVIRKGLKSTFAAERSSLVITNEHVVRRCAKDPKKDFRGYHKGLEVSLEILNYNREHDVALVSMNAARPGLRATSKPEQGTWALAVGFPLEFYVPVPVTGSVVGTLDEMIVLQMPIQHGNSGSPVLNSEGLVTATANSVYLDDNGEQSTGWTEASSTRTLCLHLFDCTTAPITQPTSP